MLHDVSGLVGVQGIGMHQVAVPGCVLMSLTAHTE